MTLAISNAATIRKLAPMMRLRAKLESSSQWILPSILLLGLIRGWLYASYMPPWGLIDEEQHVHYIQSLAEQQAIPIANKTYLSTEIVDSLFATHRWEIFHWPTPTAQDPVAMGFEGLSFQGYQPPAFYLLMAPLFAILPSDILGKVYLLRFALVVLSLLTVWIAFRITSEMFPQQRQLPYLVSLLLVLLPERTAAVSRINNDVLLEIIAATFVWVSVRTVLYGLSTRRSLLLGLLLGLGILTKVSMIGLSIMLLYVYFTRRRDTGWLRSAAWSVGITVALSVPYIVRNLSLYGDWTGLSSFLTIRGIYPRVLNAETILAGSVDMFRHFWVIWWKGALAGSNPVVDIFSLGLASLSVLSVIGLLRSGKQLQGMEQGRRTAQVIWMFIIGIASYAVSTMAVYLNGIEPVIQGRFMLPVIVPSLILLAWGLWNIPRGQVALVVTCSVLLLLDTLSLFGNLMPYFYYWSGVASNSVSQPRFPQYLSDAWSIFYPRFLSDKPIWLQPILLWLIPIYAVVLGLAGSINLIHLGQHRNERGPISNSI